MSSGALRFLKILAFAGIIVQLGVIALTILSWVIWSVNGPQIWVYLWFEFSVGLPMFGMLFVQLKNREYLKEIATKR